MPTGRTLAFNVLDNDDDVDDNSEYSDEELRALYDEGWAEHDHVLYVSGGLPASSFDSEEEPLFIGGKSIFALCIDGGASTFFLDSEEEPLLIGGRSIFAEF